MDQKSVKKGIEETMKNVEHLDSIFLRFLRTWQRSGGPRAGRRQADFRSLNEYEVRSTRGT